MVKRSDLKSSRLLAFDGAQPIVRRGGRVDRDAARLLLFRDDAFQVDMQQAGLQPGAPDHDMLGKLELARETAPGDALVQEGGLLTVFTGAGDGEDIVLDLDAEVFLGEAGDGDGDAVIVLVASLDVVGGITGGGGLGLQKIQQPVITDSGAEKRGIVETHGSTSLKR